MSGGGTMAATELLATPVADWPEAERSLWQQARAARRGLFSEEGRASHLREATAATYANGVGQWLAFLQRSGSLVPTELPAERFRIERLNDFVAEMAERGLRASSIKQTLINLKAAMRFIAPAADLSLLVRPRGISLDKALPSEQRLFTVQDRGVAMAFVLAMQAKAMAMRDGPRRRRDLRDAALIAILIAVAPRRGSLARMQLDRLVRRNDGAWLIHLRPEDTKTHIRLDLLLDQGCTRMLDAYLNLARSGFSGVDDTDLVWMGMKGSMTAEGIAQIFGKFCQACFGRAEGPHAARRWLRSEASRIAPESAFDAGLQLGHSQETSLRYYTEANTLHAGLRQAKRVSQARTGIVPKPRNGERGAQPASGSSLPRAMLQSGRRTRTER